MNITECLWLDQFVDKIISKHDVYPEEVEEIFKNCPDVRKVEEGHVKGENLYIAFGRTDAGRCIICS